MAQNWSEWIRSGDWAHEGHAAIPVLPAHIAELVQIAGDPDVPTRRVSAAVAKDPVLAMQVIRMANSAFSSPAIEITRLDDAVARLGTQSVRNVVMAGCLNAQLVDPKIYGPQGRQVVDHCVGAAVLAQLLAAPYGSSGEMFLGGLLHDIGKLLILKLAYDFRQETGEGPEPEEVDVVLVERHAAMGGWLAARWQMPTSLADPIVWHHDPDWAVDSHAITIIYAANRLAHRYGFGCDVDTADLLDDPLVGELGIDAVALGILDAKAPDLYASAKSIVSR